MFRSLGYTTEVTPASRDGGYDILLRGRDGVMSIVECMLCTRRDRVKSIQRRDIKGGWLWT